MSLSKRGSHAFQSFIRMGTAGTARGPGPIQRLVPTTRRKIVPKRSNIEPRTGPEIRQVLAVVLVRFLLLFERLI